MPTKAEPISPPTFWPMEKITMKLIRFLPPPCSTLPKPRIIVGPMKKAAAKASRAWLK
ncbi:hypothetical protein D3C80_2241620 [compost metagenome]